MTHLSVSTRERRTLVAGTLTIGALVFLGPGRRAEHAWEVRTRMNSEIAGAQLQRSLELFRGAKVVEDSLVSRRLRLRRLRPSLLTADSPAAAGPTLAGLVSRLSAAASVTISGMDVQIDSGSSHPFTIATVHMSGIGDVGGLASLVSHLEGNPARVAVKGLTITQPAPTAPGTRMEALRVDITVSAPVATWHAEHGK